MPNPSRWRAFRAGALALAGLISVLAGSGAVTADEKFDWPFWRGPEMNGVSRETGLVDRWKPNGENQLWFNPELATRSTPIIMRGKLYILARSEPGTSREGEQLICADAETGEVLWRNRFNVFLSDVPDTRVGWSSVLGDPETGKIYALGVCDLFQCLDGKTGEPIWSKSLSEEYGMLNTYGGRTNFPVIIDDLVIISGIVIGWGDMAKPAHRFIAFDKRDGTPVWFNETRLLPYDTTYSAPVLTTLDGEKALVFGSGDGAVYAMQPRTGKIIWKYQLSRRGLNTTPLVVDGIVYTGQSEENVDDTTMGAMVAINGVGKGDITKTGEIWRVTERMVGKSAGVMVDGRLYAVEDGGTLNVVDPKTGYRIDHKTGKRVDPNARYRPMKLGGPQRGSLLYADGKIYAATANGRWWILKPTDKGVKVLDRQRLRQTEIHASPIVSHGRIYLATTEGTYCIGKKDHKPVATERPAPPAEKPVAEDRKPAQLQLVPIEARIMPGGSIDYEVRLYNARGQFLGKQRADFSVDGPGKIDSDGRFEVPASRTKHSASIVTAKVGGLTGTARVRIVPELPWKFDFEDGEIPLPWVGVRYRNILRETAGNHHMVKVTTIPKGTRSQAWIGPVDLHDYTIEADVQGRTRDGKMPDIGLIAQRYTLDMQGASQALQIRTWPTQRRMAVTIPFEWKPDVWYTMKFRAANEGDKAVLRGKVWPRAEPEPKEWTIVASDSSPNRHGSPGLFGDASTAEIFLDNLTVTANDSQ